MINTKFITLLLLVPSICFSAFNIDRIEAVPDLTQTDRRAYLPGKGRMYCGPAAVSNSLAWLAGQGYEGLLPTYSNESNLQYEIARKLGSRNYMRTIVNEGTSTWRLMKGVAKYIKDAHYQFASLSYQGVGKTPKEYPKDSDRPSLEWLKEGFETLSGIWIVLGWYSHNEAMDEYTRVGGHWVTVVGYGMTREGELDPQMLIIHDPAPWGKNVPSPLYVKAEEIYTGDIKGKTSSRPAAGHYKLTGEMPLSRNSDCAILDGIVILKME